MLPGKVGERLVADTGPASVSAQGVVHAALAWSRAARAWAREAAANVVLILGQAGQVRKG